jgi:hypothetical protein
MNVPTGVRNQIEDGSSITRDYSAVKQLSTSKGQITAY